MTTLTPHELHDILLAAFGPQHWWPADTPFEVAVGAVLTQNTAWCNVERAIRGLAALQALTPAGILALPVPVLEQTIRPAGYYRVKAGYLTTLASWVQQHAPGGLASLADADAGELRQELLGLRGIGPETADSILLYALGKPVVVADAYTRRIGARLGMLPEGTTYAAAQEYFARRLPADAEMLGEFHALVVRLGKEFCGKRPRCSGCPLAARCPSVAAPGVQERSVPA